MWDSCSLSPFSNKSYQNRPLNGQFPDFSQHTKLLLTIAMTVFSFDKHYTTSVISNRLDLLASFLLPFLDKFHIIIPHAISPWQMHCVNRFLPYIFYKDALSPSCLVKIIRVANKSISPQQLPSPPPVDLTPKEQVIICK